MTDKNAGRRVLISGNELQGYSVWTIEPDGIKERLNCRSVTVQVHQNHDGTQSAEAMCYFTSPDLQIEAPRSADGVRTG